jgi:hypothetical protein
MSALIPAPVFAPAASVSGDVTLTVTTTGNDSNTARPSRVATGDKSALPFLTIQAALDALPTVVPYPYEVNVRLGAGTFAGAQLRGFIGGGTLNLKGATALATLTSGAQSGTAGAGTWSTTVVKPTAATNWTASNLVGKFLLLTGGAGAGSDPTNAPVMRPIKANTTTTLTVDAVSGMDNTTTFQIVSLATFLDRISAGDLVALRVADVSTPLTLRALDFSNAHALDLLLDVARCTNVTLDGCRFALTASDVSARLSKCTNLTISNPLFSNGAEASVERCTSVDVSNVWMNGAGQLGLSDCGNVEITKLDSTAAVGTALNLTRVHTAKVEAKCDDGGATPVYLESVGSFEAWGSNKLTGTGNTGYGVQIEKTGLYNLIGSDIEGDSGEILFYGQTRTWDELSGATYGIVEGFSGSAFATGTVHKAIKDGNYTYLGQVEISGRFLTYGYENHSQAAGLTATGTDQASALEIGQNTYSRVSTVAAGTGVRLGAGAALPGVRAYVRNAGANVLKVYPPSGGTIDGGASVNISAGAGKAFWSSSGDGLSWETE